MVLSKMYCSEQIVIPEKISNLLKTYAKGKKCFFHFHCGKQQEGKSSRGKCIKTECISISKTFRQIFSV